MSVHYLKKRRTGSVWYVRCKGNLDFLRLLMMEEKSREKVRSLLTTRKTTPTKEK